MEHRNGFFVDMSFNTDDIRGMPEHYEVDYHTGMDTELIVGTVQFSDEKAAWMKAGYTLTNRSSRFRLRPSAIIPLQPHVP